MSDFGFMAWHQGLHWLSEVCRPGRASPASFQLWHSTKDYLWYSTKGTKDYIGPPPILEDSDWVRIHSSLTSPSRGQRMFKSARAQKRVGRDSESSSTEESQGGDTTNASDVNEAARM